VALLVLSAFDVLAVSFLLLRKEFRLGHPIDAVEGILLDGDILADHFGSDTRIAQSQCQRVRQRQFAQRLFARTKTKFIGHPTSVRPRPSRRLSTRILKLTPTSRTDPKRDLFARSRPARRQ
jgi:hypothetical protein